MKVIVKCKKCGKNIEKYQSEVNNSKTKNFYCSKECRSTYRADSIQKIEFTCINCNKNFLKTLREVKGAKRQGSEIKYCSKKCMDKYNHVEKITVECLNCGKSITRRVTEIANNNFCSKECIKQYTAIVEVKCEQCDEMFEVTKSYFNKQLRRGQNIRFCSKECHTANKRINSHPVACSICNKEFYISNTSKIKDPCCSKKCRDEYTLKHNTVLTKCKHCNKDIRINKFRFDITNNNFCNRACFHSYQRIKKDEYEKCAHVLRTSNEYKSWRKKVFERDRYKCDECGNDKDRLHAHHIIHLNKIFIENNFDIQKTLESDIFNDIDNGVTLCANCHRKKHLFVYRNKKGQFCRIVTMTTEVTV